MYEIGSLESQMALAVAEAIVKQRAVHWIRYSHGAHGAHGALVAPHWAGALPAPQ